LRVDPSEFRELELRCHDLLADVPLHDVWRIPLEGGGPNRTMTHVLAVSPFRRAASSNPVVRGLFELRRGLGGLFGWDEKRHDVAAESYLHRLGEEDRARSLVSPGSAEGPFRMLFLFPAEAVAEIHNATVHAFLAMALRPRADGYDLYWAIYVKPVGRLTPFYMALIDPFRHLFVYPALIRQTQEEWRRAYSAPV
jgi:hypothetical protein